MSSQSPNLLRHFGFLLRGRLHHVSSPSLQIASSEEINIASATHLFGSSDCCPPQNRAFEIRQSICSPNISFYQRVGRNPTFRDPHLALLHRLKSQQKFWKRILFGGNYSVAFTEYLQNETNWKVATTREETCSRRVRLLEAQTTNRSKFANAIRKCPCHHVPQVLSDPVPILPDALPRMLFTTRLTFRLKKLVS